MGYAPVARILTAPDPAVSGTTIVVEQDSGARYPLPPFVGLVWTTNQIPTLGVDAEEVSVVAIVKDVVTVVRGALPIAIKPGLNLAALRTIDTYQMDEVVSLDYDYDDPDPGTVVFQVRDPEGVFVEYQGGTAFATDVTLDVEGIWNWRALADDHEPGPEHRLFVKFSDVV